MKEIILRQIHSTLFYLAFTSVMIIVPLIVIILNSRNFNADIKVISRKVVTYFGCVMFMIIGLLAFIPNSRLIINLTRDYYQTTVLTKEGYVYHKQSYVKMPVIEIDNEPFILSKEIARVKNGEYYEFEYFKYSKYVYSVKKINP